MNSTEYLSKKFFGLLGYSKKKFKKNSAKAYRFSQTNLGATVSGGLAGSILTYTFGYSKLTQERDQAVEALTIERGTNAALLQQNISDQTVISSLTAQNTQLLNDKITLKDANNSVTKDHDKCVSDMRQIALLHANSFFKPCIHPILNQYCASANNDETLRNRKSF